MCVCVGGGGCSPARGAGLAGVVPAAAAAVAGVPGQTAAGGCVGGGPGSGAAGEVRRGERCRTGSADV